MGDEQAKWSLAVNKHVAKLESDITTAEVEAAARGFSAMPGKSQMAVVVAAVGFKKALTEEGAAIYKEFRERIFQVTQVIERYRLSVAKLSLALYRERELNRIAMAQAEFEALVERHKADISRAATAIESRNVEVIRQRALTEQQVNYWKGVAVEAEEQTLGAEEELAYARLATAQERLKVVEALRAAVNAESAVVEAERSKIAALETLIAAKQSLAATKQSMIPLYESKAGAKTSLASATTGEAQSLIALARLGLEKASQKKAIWAAESAYLGARLGLTAQEGAREIAQLNVDVARNNARVEIQTAQNSIRQAVAEAKLGLEKDQVLLKYELAELRRQGDVAAVQATSEEEANLISGGYSATANSIRSRGEQAAGIIKSSAVTERNTTHNQEQNLESTTNATVTLQRKISKG